MKKLTAILFFVVTVMWASSAFAQYSALDDQNEYGPAVGFGGLILSGNDSAGNSQNDFVPTINLSGLSDWLAYQLYFGLDSDVDVWGIDMDYILADNFDECAPCAGEGGSWWFGAGLSYMDYGDIFNDNGAGISGDGFGPNLAFGYIWDEWSFNLYARYFMDEEALGLMGTINYSFDSN